MKRFARRAGLSTVAAGVIRGVAAAAGAASGKPFKVASTLDGRKVLPHRIHWIGLPTLSASGIEKVEFLIDGRSPWVEHAAPYFYGGNGGGHRNYSGRWRTPRGRRRPAPPATRPAR